MIRLIRLIHRAAVVVATLALATTGSIESASAAPAHRVIVAGPDDDAIAARVQKELTALGFETLRVGALDGCERSAVVRAAQEESAIAAACSDGDQVGVWVTDGGSLRLKDVVVVREDGVSERETTAVRAAEVTRATLAAYEAEEEARESRSPLPTPPPFAPMAWEDFDRPAPKPADAAPPTTRRAPAFLAGAGLSALMGVDASVAAFSGQAELGILRNFTATARLEYPIDSSEVGLGSTLAVAPAFAGGGVGIPLASPDARFIPRLGAGAGVAWIRATRPARRPAFDGLPGSEAVSDGAASFALHASVALSMRVYRALRLTADGVFGSTTSRLVARDRGMHVAYWGTPFGALALRLEVMFP